MADNLTTQTAALATIPTATKIHTDDLGASGHVQYMKLMDGADGGTDNIGGDAANGLDVDVTRVSGTVTIAGAVTNAGTFAVQADVTKVAGTTTDTNSGNKSAGTLRVVLATDQPALNNKLLTTPDLPSGASTAAKQPALGTAGTPSADVITVQGSASGTALPVSLASVPSHPVTNAGTFAVQASQSGTWNVGTVSTITNVVHVDDNSGSLTVDNNGTFATQNTPVAPTAVLHGVKTVTTAGTRVTLASSTACQSVTIKALIANTGTIYVGSSTVSSSNGFALLPGESVSLDIANLNTVNLDSSVNGEGVSYIGVN